MKGQKYILVSPQVPKPDIESLNLSVYRKIQYEITTLEVWKYTASILSVVYLILQGYLLYLYLPRDITGFAFFDISIYYIQPLFVIATVCNVGFVLISDYFTVSKDAVSLFQWINYCSWFYVLLLIFFIFIQFFINTTGGLVYSVLFISGLTIEYLPGLLVNIPAGYLFTAFKKTLPDEHPMMQKYYQNVYYH